MSEFGIKLSDNTRILNCGILIRKKYTQEAKVTND